MKRTVIGKAKVLDLFGSQDKIEISSFPLVILPLLLFLTYFRLIRFTDVAAAVRTLDCSSKNDLKEGHNQAEDQPDVDHLHIRGGGQLLFFIRSNSI